MRFSAWMPTLAVILASASHSTAQPPVPPKLADSPSVATSSPVPIDAPVVFVEDGPKTGDRLWAGCDYLLWWIKPQPIPLPIVAVNDLGAAPLLGAPGTRVLFGNQNQEMGTFSGLRTEIGFWFNADRTIGVEARGFLLEERSRWFNFASASGTPAAAYPIISPPSFAQTTVPINGAAGGSITIATHSQLWGAEANAILGGFRTGPWDLQVLAGFRHLSLHEKFDLVNPFRFASDAGDDAVDIFHCTNRFYGAQVGARVGLRSGRLLADISAKVALGTNHEEVNISGFDTPVGGVTTPGGIYTNPSNIGRTLHDEFTVIPEVQVKIGFALTNYLRATVGYDFLYWNQVVRPGNQIDARVLPVGNPTDIPARFNRTDFWAHGVSFGIEWQF
jgi:hypothetical protein